jgi:Saxitoxin biosynthesis operon protein SxtJ
MIEINFHPSRQELRTFGLAFLVAGGLGGFLLAWRFGLGAPSIVLWALAPIGGLLALVAPRALRPLYILLTVLAWPIGMVVGTVSLAVVYYVVITPLGLVFRLLGKDPMSRRFDRQAATYWIERRQAPSVERYFRQF